MDIKNIRKITNMTQAEFGKYYNIPIHTIKKWETDPSSANHRDCPEYVKQLLERVVRIDFAEFTEVDK